MSGSKDGEKLKGAVNKSKRIIIVVACIVVIYFIALFVCMQCKDCDGFVDIDCMDMLCDECCYKRHALETSDQCSGAHYHGEHIGVEGIVGSMFDGREIDEQKIVASMFGIE